MPDTLQHALCLYKRLDNGVHKFTFRNATPAAVNEWYEVMCAIAEITVDDEVVRVLIDNRLSEMLPMNSMLQRSRDLSGRFPQRSKTRTVILYNPGSLASLAENFTRLSQTDQREKVRFFPGEVQDEAMAWLLANDD